MEKEFVPYDESLALKELGFDEDCFGYYVNAELDLTWKFSDCSLYQDTHISILAPIFSQAFRWFREKYGLSHYNIRRDYNISEDGVRSYDDIELECIKKLIEIVKNK